MNKFVKSLSTKQEDTNIFGGIHGGTIIKLLCDTAEDCITQYYKNNKYRITGISEVDFLQPLTAGDLLEAHGTIEDNSSPLKVQAYIYKDNMLVARGTIVFETN